MLSQPQKGELGQDDITEKPHAKGIVECEVMDSMNQLVRRAQG